MKTNLLLFLIACSVATAGDTPFLKFNCRFDSPTDGNDFVIQFAEDESKEVQEWNQHTLRRTSIQFTKQDPHSVSVRIQTGVPLLSYAVPEEYRFTAPLKTEQFDFAFTLKDPANIDGDLIKLVCRKTP